MVDVLALLLPDVALMKEEIALLRQALVNGAAEFEGSQTKVKMPKLKAFKGTRSLKDLELFLWLIEHYLDATRIPTCERVLMAVMYLSRVQNCGGGPKKKMWNLASDHKSETGHL